MKSSRLVRSGLTFVAIGAGLMLAGYGSLAARAWIQYGRPRRPRPDEADPLLDRFMPTFDVVERHQIHVAAPADVVLASAEEMDLQASPFIAAIFKAREIVLAGRRNIRQLPRGLLEQVQSLGWRVLADEPGREIVVGAVTRPWEADVIFHGVSPQEFTAFDAPGYVKIAWTLRADPIANSWSVFRTETRAVATDAEARIRFRRYWSFVSPGVGLIRWLSLGPMKAEAERRTQLTRASLPMG